MMAQYLTLLRKTNCSTYVEVSYIQTLMWISSTRSYLGEAKHTIEEWHKFLGHCNVTDVQKLEATANGMHILSKDKFNCTTCALGKMTQYKSREPDKIG